MDYKKQIKALTFDFDGTALQKDQIWISYRNMHALRQCQKLGILCIPCTGRNANMFPPQIDKDNSFRYWVTSAGSLVLDKWTGETIYQQTFTPEQTADLCTLYEGMSIYSEVAAAGRLYFEQDVLNHLERYPVPPHHIWYLEEGRQIGVYGKLSDFFLNQQIGAEKFNLYGVPEHHRQKLADELRSRPFVEFLDGTMENAQFYSAETDRIKAVETLLDRLGLGFENLMSIGDSMGMDSAIIERAGLGITVANAPDALKEMADYVTDYNYKDGMAKAIEYFLL